MELWTEYEGTTIDGAFPLTKLLRPEGRSAFFSTANGTGVPRLIRLIESHFDDDEILTRWRGVAALNHPHLLNIEKFGLVELDQTTLVYAVMEPVDANLAEVVSRQRLTLPETRQLAASLVAALDALPSHGFVHEHIEPHSVFAVGEVVKLRSDCIREAPEGAEGLELKRRDVRDAAVVLLEALTQQRRLEAAGRDLPLPAPFDQIVPKSINGDWGLAEIAAALKLKVAPDAVITPSDNSRPVALNGERSADAQTASSPKAAPQPAETPLSADMARVPAAPARVSADPAPRSFDSPPRSALARPAVMFAIGLAVILALSLAWRSIAHRSSTQSNVQPVNVAPAVQSSAPDPPPASASAVPATAAPAQKPAPINTGNGDRVHWRVVTYTYNHEPQAQHKVATIATRHPDLQPEVFTPTGHAPFLVTVGGAMSRDEAFALVKKLRSEGLPQDSYAQNYTGGGR
jgi:hypothetical protein